MCKNTCRKLLAKKGIEKQNRKQNKGNALHLVDCAVD